MTTNQTKTLSSCINATKLMERGEKRRSRTVETAMLIAQQEEDDTSIDSGMDTETNSGTNDSTTNASTTNDSTTNTSITASISAETINNYDLPALN